MQIARLRIAGFKSFVDPAEFRIEPGLTGVVGPNGCGKSNILEALRWVMGAASAKAMRGEGMDDVIFAGAAGRPARNHAEVSLLIDNAEADAPAPFQAEPIIEVSRRIDRGEGSTFRVNGREARARDVQILFADASTGANSPALVRQGQISELIAAKPQNRRRILEEAAGVAGLHGRRHEAELRVAAAQANLERLDEVAREIDARLARLRREARAAARWRAVSAEIRALQSGLLLHRWREARAARRRLEAEAKAAAEALEGATRVAAAASAKAIEADAALPPLRAADAAAQAALNRLAIERDRLERAIEEARAEQSRLESDLARIAGDDEREAAWLAEAVAALARLDAEAAELRALAQAAPERGPALEAAANAAEARRADAEAEVEALAARLAAAEAEAKAADARLDEVEGRLARSQAELAAAREERAGLAGPDAADETGAEQAADRASAALAAARDRLAACENARGAAHAAETLARMKAREAEDALAGARTEAAALRRLTETTQGRRYPPVLNQVSPDAGLEAALAAALGDDLDAALDPAAHAHWAGASAEPPVWPKGAEPLAGKVAAPAALAARLAFTALVAAADGPALQKSLAPGMRLVSREGDLWRWDGLIVRAATPRPARVRLEQKARLTALDNRLAELTPAAEAAHSAHARSSDDVQAAEAALRTARAEASAAESDLAQARSALESALRDAAGRRSRAAALMETIARLERDGGELETQAQSARAAHAAARLEPDLARKLAEARAAAAAARETASDALLTLDAEAREAAARAARLAAIAGERAAWSERIASANTRRQGLAKARGETLARLGEARGAPARREAGRAALLDELARAEAAKSAAADALARAEEARAEADRAARTADSRSADARAARASVLAHLDGARERLDEHAAALAEASGCARAALEDRFAGEDLAAAEPGAAERRLAELDREREQIGPVNLLAEEEVSELAGRAADMAAERADLAQALARLRQGIGELNAEGRERLLAAFEIVQGHFRELFTTLFQGGEAELRLVESEDPLEAGLEILACPPGKRMSVMSLMSGGEQALTAMALIFAVFLHNPAPVCVLDEADAPLDDANVERFCDLLAAMRARASTRFIVISHNALTMSRMDRLYGVTMREAGVSQLVAVDLRQAEALVAS